MQLKRFKAIYWIGGIAFVFLFGCSSTPKPPDKVLYTCDFYVSDYYPDAPSRVLDDRISSLMVWFHNRMKGGFSLEPGTRAFQRIEQNLTNRNTAYDNKVLRSIWLIPANLTKNNNPMNVMLERRGEELILTRIPEKELDRLGFSSRLRLAFEKYCPQV